MLIYSLSLFILESLYQFRILESDQLTTVLELFVMEIHQKISMPNDQKLKTMVKRSKDQVVLKEDTEFAISGKQKGSVREETDAVFGTTVMSV